MQINIINIHIYQHPLGAFVTMIPQNGYNKLSVDKNLKLRLLRTKIISLFVACIS